MGMVIMRRIKFCAGHRLLNHESKCAYLHGHNYSAEFYVTSENQDAVGRVIDFSVLKRELKGWIDEHWDHGFLLNEKDVDAIRLVEQMRPARLFLLPCNPTAENIARYLLENVCPDLLSPYGVRAVKVIVWETDESFAEATCDAG